jgi:hypothetical protein
MMGAQEFFHKFRKTLRDGMGLDKDKGAVFHGGLLFSQNWFSL